MHLLLLTAVFALFMGRKLGSFQSQSVIDVLPGFYSHVSNFALSYLLVTGVGFLWLLMGVSVRYIALAALALILTNAIYEFLVPWLNTQDPIDAAYGVAGTLLGFAWLWVVARTGLKALPAPAK
ncbi:MAG: hypothetical protein ABI114_12605 [Rhodanobacter sp.]